MAIAKLVYFFVLSLVLLQGCHAYATKPKVDRCHPNMKLAEKLTFAAVKANLDLAAEYIRGGFHDCITTKPGHKGAGCNGSLRLRVELAHRQNRGLDNLLKTIEPIVRKTCISYADAIQIGQEAAMELTGGKRPHIGRNKIDAQDPDPVDGELPGRLTFEQLKEFFARKGFNVQEMVASDVGGHSLGDFFGNQFTPDPNKFDNAFAKEVLRIHENQPKNPEFNTLSTDRAMTVADGLFWVKTYADGERGLHILKKDFADYLVKQSKILVR